MKHLYTSAVVALLSGLSTCPGWVEPPVPIKVVIVTFFEVGEDTGDTPGELQNWVERMPLPESLPFDHGYRPLRYHEDGILAICTGVGTARSASSIMALGMDPRFDLSKAYWLMAGISGADPTDMSLGSAAWAEWVVDGDLSHSIDIREAPAGWETGRIPLRKSTPFELPLETTLSGHVYRLDPGLVNWAFELTQDTPLMDTPEMEVRRKKFVGYPEGQRAPFVLKGDQLAAMNYWHGELMNAWANDWVAYYTEGQGNFVTTAMEDTGVLQALSFLDRAGKVDVDRAMVLRTASNYSMQWPKGTAAESLAGEKLGSYSGYIPSLDAAQKVGGIVVRALVDGWGEYEEELPGG